MLSYRGLIEDATKTLYQSSETPRIDAEFLMQHAIQQSMAWLIAYGDSTATAEHSKTFANLIAQRAKGVPVAYLLGYRDFWTLRLKVNEHVLIPRGDTEVLVEQALERISEPGNPRIADLGTGSGAIILSIAKERPTSSCVAVDQSQHALSVAQENAIANNINNVEFIHSNWCEHLSGEFDLIASNPPYVEANDPHLDQGDLRFEPNSALIADEHGLGDLKTIIESAPRYLKQNGWLLLEHGYNQAQPVNDMLANAGFSDIQLYADLNHLPRCTAAQWSK